MQFFCLLRSKNETLPSSLCICAAALGDTHKAKTHCWLLSGAEKITSAFFFFLGWDHLPKAQRSDAPFQIISSSSYGNFHQIDLPMDTRTKTIYVEWNHVDAKMKLWLSCLLFSWFACSLQEDILGKIFKKIKGNICFFKVVRNFKL